MTDIMIDLETLSTRHNAAILVIAAIKFNREEKWSRLDPDLEQKDTFYRKIKLKSCKDIGCHVDPKTVEWWDTQDKKIRDEALGGDDRVSLKKALKEFTEWFGDSTFVWGNGSSFDLGILGESYKRCAMEVPWKFWFERDLRTIFDLGGIRASQLPQCYKHHALYDCWRQIIGFQMAISYIK